MIESVHVRYEFIYILLNQLDLFIQQWAEVLAK